MYKHYSDFPEIMRDGKPNFYALPLKIFQDGLDPSLVVPQNSYYATFFRDIASAYDKSETHILHYLLDSVRYTSVTNKEETVKYFKDTLLELIKNNKIEEKQVKELVFATIADNLDYGLIDFFAENKLLDVKEKTPLGYSVLMLAGWEKNAEKLLELGADPNAKVENRDSDHYGFTAYEIAVKEKQKKLVKLYQNYLPNNQLEEHNKNLIAELQSAKNNKKKIEIYRTAMTENAVNVIEDIKNNQEKYKDLIEYEDGNNVSLLVAALRHGNVDFLNHVIEIDYYKKNKEKLSKHGECYTGMAIANKKDEVANLLYINGFKNDQALIDKLTRHILSKSIANKLVEDGHHLSLHTLFRSKASEGINRSHYTKEEIDDFFKLFPDVLRLEKAEYIGSKNELYLSFDIPLIYPNYSYQITKTSLDTICAILKQQEKVDPENFNKNLIKFAAGIGFHQEKRAMRMLAISLNNLPEHEKVFLDNLQFFGKKDWVTKINKENLEKILLAEIKEENKKSVRMKI